MISFEFKKILINKSVLGLLLFMCIMNIAKMYVDNSRDTLLKDEYSYQELFDEDFLSRVSGTLNDDTWNMILEGRERYCSAFDGGEYVPFDEKCYEIYDRYEYQYHYKDKCRELAQKAQDNLSFYRDRNAYLYSRNQVIKGLFSGRELSSFMLGEGFSFLFGYKFSSMLLVLMILFISERIFFDEKISGMDIVLKSNYYSKKNIAKYKYILFVITIILIEMVFSLEDVLSYSGYVSLSGWTNRVYAMQEYKYCLWGVSILTYYLMIIGCRILCGIMIGSIFIAIGMAVKQKTSFYFVNILLIMVCIILAENSIPDGGFLSLMNPFSLFYVNEMVTGISTINCFGMAVPNVDIAVILCALGTMILIYINSRLFRKCL